MGGGRTKDTFRGSIPIDGVYHTRDLEIVSTVQLSFHESVGDHRSVLVDISTRSAIGELGFKIVQPKARKLSSSNEKRSAQYRKYVEEQLELHQLPPPATPSIVYNRRSY